LPLASKTRRDDKRISSRDEQVMKKIKSESHFVSCPICKVTMLVAWNGKLLRDDRIQDKIEKHVNSHTIGEIIDFIELNLAGQVNELAKKLKENGVIKKM
jgi:hypothetical protein